jgi:hypothetical protein
MVGNSTLHALANGVTRHRINWLFQVNRTIRIQNVSGYELYGRSTVMFRADVVYVEACLR